MKLLPSIKDKINNMILKENKDLTYLENQPQNKTVSEMIIESRQFIVFLNNPETDWLHYLNTKK